MGCRDARWSGVEQSAQGAGVDHHGVVHDPTWPDGAGLAYLGVPFTSAYLATFERTQEARVHDFYVDDYALLRQGVPASAIADVGTDLHAAGGA